MADSEQGEKTEEATPQRREDFRRRGQVAQTKELGSFMILSSSLLCLWMLSGFFMDQLSAVFSRSFSEYLVVTARSGDWLPAVKFAALKSAMVMAPLMGMLWVISFASSALQVGFLVNEEAMKFDFKKIDPIQGLKRLFSMRSVVEGAKAVAKVLVVGFIAYLVLKTEAFKVPYLVSYSVEQLMGYVGGVITKLFMGVCVFMAILAVVDYLFQRWDLEQKMMMTKQEVKEEMKSREGDPLIKSRIRRTQREMASRRMMEDVPTADVIVTNPTHIAVALKYSAQMVAPQVVAMGAGVIAEKIKAVAKENNVPIVENKPLARTIFKTMKIGEAIPRELYTAVAEVLSYIFKLKRKRRV